MSLNYVPGILSQDPNRTDRFPRARLLYGAGVRVGEEEQQLMSAGRSVDEETAEDLSIIKMFGTCRCVHQARPQALRGRTHLPVATGNLVMGSWAWPSIK